MKEQIKQQTHKDVAESARVGRKVRAKAKQCYMNAWRVIQHVPGYETADYVEGMAVLDGIIAIEHGWVEKDCVIVDPTLHEDDLTYFPGLRFKGQRGQAEALEVPVPEDSEEGLPSFYRFGWGGIDSPAFRSALVAAYRFVGMEDLARRYEEYEPRHATEVVADNTAAVVLASEGGAST